MVGVPKPMAGREFMSPPPHSAPTMSSRNEQAFRFNERVGEDADRIARTLGSVAGRRLTYDEFTDKQAFNWTRLLSP